MSSVKSGSLEFAAEPLRTADLDLPKDFTPAAIFYGLVCVGNAVVVQQTCTKAENYAPAGLIPSQHREAGSNPVQSTTFLPISRRITTQAVAGRSCESGIRSSNSRVSDRPKLRCGVVRTSVGRKTFKQSLAPGHGSRSIWCGNLSTDEAKAETPSGVSWNGPCRRINGHQSVPLYLSDL